jgi:hypothetical protein
MSRGYGSTQRAILAWLARTGDMSLPFLAACIYQTPQDELSANQLNKTRNALTRLIREGTVSPGAIDGYGRNTWRLSGNVRKRTARPRRPHLIQDPDIRPR